MWYTFPRRTSAPETTLYFTYAGVFDAVLQTIVR